ncbi:PHP domain-containing protein [Cellulosimicrobium marinum]|uniref:PHP domain-containing protein n=1 Tax=Cellulosimicrobium marinum TaxID=1638992 RepID=UPI001E64B6AB|nr:PHP domain-containing protein [Cellulosimicrobium marinum]MCB7137316.1 PHP domain-containing protein [Cellulosimicrobium marinum]
MPTPRYAELHAHSAFSFLDGASHPEELAAEGARLGLTALAVTDHDGLYGVVRFAEAARKVGLDSIFGAELHLPAPAPSGAPVLDPPTGVPDPRSTHLLVLARGPQGYRNLSSAIGTAHLATGTKGAADHRLDTLGEQADGQWLVLTGCRKGAVRRALVTTGRDAARRELDRLVATFGADNVAVEITADDDPRTADLHDALAALATDAHLPLVATTAAHYARPRDADLAGALAAVRARSSLDDMDGWLPGAPTAHLRSAAEMLARHRRHPEAVATAAALGDECAFDLRLVAPALPPYPVPDGHTEATWLRELVRRGAEDRYGPRGSERVPGAWAQIDHELRVIEDLGFPGYFLVVYDLVEFCRVHGILAQGRGSAANSAVCYALGITAVDAVRHGLLFERFLAPERDGPPDIDVDIESARREEVIQHVYGTFGRTHAAQVANVISYRPKSAVRDAARALGYDVGQADAWSKSIERWGSLRGPDPTSPAADRAAKERDIAAKVVTRTAAKDARVAALWGPAEGGGPEQVAAGREVGVARAASPPRASPLGPLPPDPATAARATPTSPRTGTFRGGASRDVRVVDPLAEEDGSRRTERGRGVRSAEGRGRVWREDPRHEGPDSRPERGPHPPAGPDRSRGAQPGIDGALRADDTHDVVPAHRPPSAEQDGEIPGEVLDLADRMLRLPRHLGIHSGGMVMCDRPVIEVCPVEWARMEGRTVLQWDKEDCADAGLVKFDLLGLGMLTALRIGFGLVERHEGSRLELHTLPAEDPAVYDLLCAADTVGVFQVESRAQMATLPRLRPRTFYDIVVEVALIRPGPIQGGSVHPYINRVRGREPVTFLHPLLEKSLGRTMGVPLFQEQLMQMAIDVADFTPAESDQLRRAMGSKRSVERMEALRERLMDGMRKKGVDDARVREQIYDKLKAFADFGFPESHAYSFAFLVYASSWLKVHHPAAFYAGLLAAQPMGFYSPQSLVADARRHGVTVLRPDVNASDVEATVERLPSPSPAGGSEDRARAYPPDPRPSGPPARPDHGPRRSPPPPGARPPRIDTAFGPEPDLGLAVRLGLASVRGLGKDAAERIVAARDAPSDGGTARPFRDLRDLVRRVDLTTTQLEGLATAGATDCLGVTRREALWAAGALSQEGPGTLPGVSVGVEAPPLPGMSDVETSVADVWATGVSTDSYPTQYVRDGLTAAGVLTVAGAVEVADAIAVADDAEHAAGEAPGTRPGSRVAVGGVVTHRQRPGTAGGVTFLSLEDETGILNVVCSPGLWRRFRTVARSSAAMVVRGRLERADGATNLVAEHLAPLSLQVSTTSRDFR